MKPHDTKSTRRHPKGSGKLQDKLGSARFSNAPGRACDGHRLTMLEMSSIKRDDAVDNSRRNRGEDTRHPARTQHVQCGCGAEGCVFVSHWPAQPVAVKP